MVQDPDIVPSSTYVVVAECGAFVSPPGSADTWLWADLDNDADVDYIDIATVVEGFKGEYTGSYEILDLHPCPPDGEIDYMDIAWVAWAFQGMHYPCAIPCP